MSSISNLAKSNIKTNKNRSILTIITIVLTTCLLTAVGIICSNWGEVNIQTSKSMFGSHHAVFRKSTTDENKNLATHVDIESMQIVKTIGDYKDIESNSTLVLQCSGVVNDNYISEINIKEGSFPSSENEILISEGYMKSLGKEEPKIGDTISVEYSSRKDGKEKSKEFVVSGLIKSSEEEINERRFFGLVSKEYLLANEYDEETTFTTYIRFKDENNLNEYLIQEKVDEITAAFNIPSTNAKVNVEYIRGKNPDMTIISGGVAIAFLVVISSVLVIYSIFYISVINKVQEFGKIRALGATKKQVKALILREGMMLSCIAMPFGILLGYLIGKFAVSKAVTGVNISTGSYDLIILAVSAIVSVLTVYISILKPMKIASKISPVEAMKYNGESTEKTLDRHGYDEMNIKRLLKANLKRNKKRTIITIISLSLSGILFIIASTILTSISIEKMTDHGYEGSKITIGLSNYTLDSPENPDKDIYTIQKNNPITYSMDKIKEIPGVKEVKTNESTPAKWKEMGDYHTFSIGGNKDYEDKSKILDGEINLENEDGVILDHPYTGEVYGVKVGDKITIEYYNDGVKAEKQLTVIAITDNVMGGTFILPEKTYRNLFKDDTTSSVKIYIDDDKYEDIKKEISKLVKNEVFLEASYYDISYKNNEKAVRATKIMAYSLVVVIGIIGFINLINTMITSIVVRKKELGMLQAIGLSNKQFVKMIQLEGIFYVGLTIFITLTLGNILGYVAFVIFRNTGATYASYTYPLIQTVLLIIMTVIGEIIISNSIIKSFNKNSLVDRIRYSE